MDGDTLCAAAYAGKLERVQAHLEAGRAANARDEDGRTALIWAASGGHAEVVELLLRQPDVDVNAQDEGGWTALMCACSAGHWRVAQRLLDSQADPNLRNEAGCTALHYHKGRDVVAELLVTSGGTPNVRDAYGHSPLSRAVSAGQESVVRILLEAGATADSEDSEGNTPLHIACEEGNERIARMLVEEGARLDKRNRAGKTPPDLAAPRLRSAMQHAAGGRE